MIKKILQRIRDYKSEILLKKLCRKHYWEMSSFDTCSICGWKGTLKEDIKKK